MRLRRQLKAIFQGRNRWHTMNLLRRKRRSGSRILMILSGIGTVLAAFQLFRNVNGNDHEEHKEKRKAFSPVSPVVQRSPKRPARRPNYALATELAEEFLKNGFRGKKSG